MLNIPSVLGRLIKEYHEDALANGRESRIVVPGLTPKISSEIHEYLLENGITAYLVIGDDLSPDKDKLWIRPVGLTSKRIGSFVAVACPGQLSHIQDSIRGSGGTIRSVAFSEEWPWIDNGSESFRFNGPVLKQLVTKWATSKEDQKWLSEFVLTCLVPSTRSCSQRANVLLEELLGNFSPTLYRELGDVRLKMLFHSGIPLPEGDIPPVNRLRHNTSRLCERIVDVCRKEDEARHQALDMVPKVVPSEEESIVKESLNVLLDGIGCSKTLDLGVLGFFSCWGSDTRYWSRLNADRLERLFEIEPRERGEITCTIKCDRSLVSSGGSSLATFHGEEVRFFGEYRLPQSELNQHVWTLRLRHRQSVLQLEKLDSVKGNFCFLLNTASAFTRYKSGLPLKLALFADEDIRAEERIKLHLCGLARPAFAVVESGFEVVDASPRNEDEVPDKKVESNEPSYVHMFSHDGREPKLLDLDENELPIMQTGHQGIWRSGGKIDPFENASGQMVIICQFGSLAAVICFETKDIQRGEFTIEDELRVQIAGLREGDMKELIAIFGGQSKEPYRRLGKINKSSLRRIMFANDMTGERGWRPLIVDLLGDDNGAVGLLGDYVTFRGTVEAPAFNSVLLPQAALKFLKDYASIRFELLQVIRSNIETTVYSTEHPDYATCPIYVDTHARQVNNLLMRYLHVYRRLLEYIEHEYHNLEWSQLFVLVYLDCVVHWDDSVLRNSFFLVGPWHPLVLSKRYMVQASLFNRAKGLEERNGKAFRQLAVLLKEVTGFRWLTGLHRNDRLLEPLYTTPTSDPGWHLAIKQDLSTIAAQSSVGSLIGILESLRGRVGLESPILQGYTEDLARSGLSDFMRAFPGRRSLGVRVRRGYSTSEMVASIHRLLHEDEVPLGLQLPGGIHLFTEEPMGDVEELKWSDPPILAYHYENDQECFREATPDIYLLGPSREISFRPADEWHGLPRGLGDQSVFSEPLCWLTEGQSELPSSVSLEFDEEPQEITDLGTTFVTVTAKICHILLHRVVIVRSVALPLRLDCPWAIVPGGGLDPAILVKYVRDGSSRSLQDRILWDYRIDITGSKSTYYVLSTIPRSFAVIVNGFFGREDVAKEFIENLGELGVAVGGEALKSGRRALGVVGLVGTIRLVKGIGGSGKGAFSQSEDCIGFLVPVDSFFSFFGCEHSTRFQTNGDLKRTDLLAIQLVLPKDEQSRLGIYACGIESKFVSGTLSQVQAVEALRQAQSSLGQFRSLVETSKERWAMPERLGLLAIVKFGLRLTSPNAQGRINAWVETERTVLRAILQGRYDYYHAVHDALVVSTEEQLPGVAEVNNLAEGMWIRINRDHWPGIADTQQLEEMRDELSHLFDIRGDLHDTSGDRDSTPPTGPVELSEGVSVASGKGEELRGPDTDGGPNIKGELERVDDSHALKDRHLEKILLGVDDARRPVYFDPQSPVDPLDNLNLMVSGSSGTGKTQLLKYLICEIRGQGKNVLVLDFKNDFASDPEFLNRASLERVFVNFDGLPFNPLLPYPVRHPDTGELVIQTGQHISGVASVLKRTYGLGPQQQVALKNAIVEAFTDMGIPTTGTSVVSESVEFPDFSSVGEILQRVNPTAYSRLDPLFTLDLFRTEHTQSSFHALVNRSMILDVSQIPSDEIKNALAELVVLSAHAYYDSQSHSGIIRQFLVFDEAHRILGSDFMTRLVRECRAYGVGTILSSQYPKDFPAEISGSMATKILHHNGRDAERVRNIVQMIGCSGREADVSNLGRFQAFVDNRHFPHTLVRTMNYPAYLVWIFLSHCGETARDKLANLEGIDTDKLPIGNLLKELERLGLIEEREGRIRPLQYHQ